MGSTINFENNAYLSKLTPFVDENSQQFNKVTVYRLNEKPYDYIMIYEIRKEASKEELLGLK